MNDEISPYAKSFVTQVDSVLDQWVTKHDRLPKYIVMSNSSVMILYSDVNNVSRKEGKKIMMKVERTGAPYMYRNIPVIVSPSARNEVVITDKWPWSSAEWQKRYEDHSFSPEAPP